MARPKEFELLTPKFVPAGDGGTGLRCPLDSWVCATRTVIVNPRRPEGGLAQRWADRPVASIDAHDVWSVIDEARRAAMPGIAARNRGISDARVRALFAALSSMFSWLKRQRRVESNPCAGVHRPTGPEARDRVLTADEIRWFWVACKSGRRAVGSWRCASVRIGPRPSCCC